MKKTTFSGMTASLALAVAAGSAMADTARMDVLEAQRAKLAENTANQGFGPQSPRDLEQREGVNLRKFAKAPPHTEMNLCNIHFHKNAEHRGGEYTTFAGPGNGKGYNTGYRYSGKLSKAQLQPVSGEICPSEYGSLQPGDTIESHYVFTSALVTPGPTLGACLSESTMNPQLRVEGQVFVLANDDSAMDFRELSAFAEVNGYHQPLNLPQNTGKPIEYLGSTTGPGYNEKGSPLQVSWSMRPKVAIVDIETVGQWCQDNAFDEKAAHGVRNLVVSPDLLSPMD
ncbi:MAG: delta-class carbonic anhydrase [Oleiphilaceae bacterium]|nr:delta-class carbonic anhydrase [Oleiphilaceae bacterium]